MPETKQDALFELAPPGEKRHTYKPIHTPIWTEQKAKLIATYIRYFAFVTRHGAYIDGFAGPQTGSGGGFWAAEEVLNLQPARIRQVFLCELAADRVEKLRALDAVRAPVPGRSIQIYPGDFNATVDQVLSSGLIRPTVATFALLDQHTFECDWATVVKLARHKPPGFRKIELFYFVPTGWLGRATNELGSPDVRMRRWWGRDDWRQMVATPSGNRGRLFASRMREEFGYYEAASYPVREQRGQGKVMYHMIHASDHPAATSLMRRAYINATKSPETAQQINLALRLPAGAKHRSSLTP